jgi:hypothetical protein
MEARLAPFASLPFDVVRHAGCGLVSVKVILFAATT